MTIDIVGSLNKNKRILRLKEILKNNNFKTYEEIIDNTDISKVYYPMNDKDNILNRYLNMMIHSYIFVRNPDYIKQHYGCVYCHSYNTCINKNIIDNIKDISMYNTKIIKDKINSINNNSIYNIIKIDNNLIHRDCYDTGNVYKNISISTSYLNNIFNSFDDCYKFFKTDKLLANRFNKRINIDLYLLLFKAIYNFNLNTISMNKKDFIDNNLNELYINEVIGERRIGLHISNRLDKFNIKISEHMGLYMENNTIVYELSIALESQKKLRDLIEYQIINLID